MQIISAVAAAAAATARGSLLGRLAVGVIVVVARSLGSLGVVNG